MKIIARLLGIAMAIVLATLPLPSMADTPNKHFALLMGVGAPENTQSNTIVTATISNDNPSGSSAQFSSFTLSVANVSGITIVGVQPDPVYGGTYTVSPDGTSVSVSNISPVKATKSYVLTLNIAGCGDRNTWSATVFAGNNFNGGTYIDDSPPNQNATNIACGALACGGTVGGATVSTLIDTTLLGNDGFPSRRGPFNEDGTCAATVNYFVTELATPTGDPYLHFRWATNQRGAAFFYILDQPLNLDPLSATKTLFGWIANSPDDVNASPIYVLPQACDQGSNAKFPGSYGKLIADNGRTLKVDTTTTPPVYAAPVPPFRIALGPKPMEYMTVTKINGQTWTVTRGAGATTHATGIDVMSTPLPALSSPLACYDATGTKLASCPTGTYAAGQPARMCYVPPDTRHIRIFDVGDGYVKGSFN
jgi:hypothetical protein